MPYTYLEEIATADVAFEAEGRTPEEMFREAAIATFEVMVDTKNVKPAMTKMIELENDTIDGLLFDWLSELVYLKDVEAFLFCGFEVSIKKNDAYKLTAVVSGENIDPLKHSLRTDVKAVTYYMFEVKKSGGTWKSRVVLDI